MLTQDQERRVIEAIADCTRLIDKEERRNPTLRPDAAQKLLAFNIAHRAKLVAMLDPIHA